jgi:hypothetical protein
MKRDHQEITGGIGISTGKKAESSSSSMATEKGKLWVEDDQDEGGLDELLAVLGYKILSLQIWLRAAREGAYNFSFLRPELLTLFYCSTYS